MFNTSLFKTRLFSAAAATIILSSGMGGAQAETPAPGGEVAFNIDAPLLGDALRAFGAQSGTPILFPEALVAGRAAPGLQGSFAPDAALERLLQGSGLEAVKGQGGAVIIRQRAGTPEPAAAPAHRPQEDTPARTLPERSQADGDTGTLRIDTVTVTGTSLRGIAPESSPLQVYSRDEILGSGVTTTEQFIRTLPQNFGGGSSEFAPGGLPNDINSRQNNTFGTSANLRGLGSRGTLVLLNGNRLAPTSKVGDFVDLSLIPVSALERVDVLTDGASSIYGGDAVAGVINFVLRDDFEGAETSARYGAVTEGDMAEYRLSQTLGTAWGSGNILGTYEYFDRGNLTLADRPDIGLPLLTDGTPVPDTGAVDLLPEQSRHSAVVSVRQAVGPALELSGSGLYSKRDVVSHSILNSAPGYAQVYTTDSESFSGSFGADYALAPGWFASADATYSQIRNEEVLTFFLTQDPSVDQTDSRSDLWSLDAQVNGNLFSLPGGTVKAALGGHVRRESFRNESQSSGVNRDADRDVSAVYGEILLPVVGEGNALPLARRLELNLSGRFDDYSDFGSSFSPKAGLLWSPAAGLNLRTSYSESFAPPPLGRVGALDRTGSVSPYQLILDRLGLPLPDASLAGVDYMVLGGTAADLDAEESRTFTAGLDFVRDTGSRAWSATANYYDIAFDGRLGSTPVPGNVNINAAPGIAFATPGAFPAGTIIFNPDPDELSAILAGLAHPVRLNAGASLDNIGIINAVNVVRNIAATQTRGLDAQFTYRAETAFGRVSAGLNANYILEFTEQAAATTPPVETANTLYNPVDLKIRANAGIRRGGFNGTLFLNYTDTYQTDTTQAATGIGSWTTFDAALSYTFEDRSGWLEGAAVDLSITNLFDRAPPATPSRGAFLISGFDPTNASPLGRFVALELRKRF
tara:strand:+ start:101 stop:2860 length:2760 start_codon:yes stop_codon:yes gene_type:complete